MINKKVRQDEKSYGPSLKEARELIDYLTFQQIDITEKEEIRNFLSAPVIPTCLRELSPKEVNNVINTQFPKKWMKKISVIKWK